MSDIQIENIMTGFYINKYGDLLPSFAHFANLVPPMYYYIKLTVSNKTTDNLYER